MIIKIFAIITAILLGTSPSWAALGQSVDSVRSDQARLHGDLLSMAQQGYTVQQIKSADGTTIKEYVSTSGIVFAISWEAPMLPKLADLLGSYFPEFQQASSGDVHRRGPLVMRLGDLVVESGGHMRAFRGRAYLPGMIPENLTAGVVK